MATAVAVSSRPLRSVRDHFSDIIDRVDRQHEGVVVTWNGHDAAVLISPATAGRRPTPTIELTDLACALVSPP